MLGDREKALMRDFNPWWEGKEVIVPEYKRHVFSDVEKYMKTKQIIAIVGLRRVGKTVLMKQVIRQKAGEVRDKKSIMYFLFDDLLTRNPEILEELLEYYLKTVAGDGKKYVFLDEIQKVPYWQDVLKRFYDTREDVKFVVSGSASLQIKKSKESLAGRVFDFHLPILTFREFLELNGLKAEKAATGADELKRIYEENAHKKPVLEQMFINYVFRGAFPEMALQEDEEIVKNYVKSSVTERIIMDDIPSAFGVRRRDILSAVLEYCSRETSNLLDVTSLANTLGINYQTARSHLFYLQNAFILDIVYNYSKSVAKQLRKNKKIHIAHPSIAMAMTGYSREALNVSEVISKYAESVVFQHSKLLSERVFFWRTPQKEEVDIILDLDPVLPIEVKYRNQISASDTNSITMFMKKHGLKKGIVVTKNLFEEKKSGEGKILFVPAWLFLLTV